MCATYGRKFLPYTMNNVIFKVMIRLVYIVDMPYGYAWNIMVMYILDEMYGFGGNYGPG